MPIYYPDGPPVIAITRRGRVKAPFSPDGPPSHYSVTLSSSSQSQGSDALSATPTPESVTLSDTAQSQTSDAAVGTPNHTLTPVETSQSQSPDTASIVGEVAVTTLLLESAVPLITRRGRVTLPPTFNGPPTHYRVSPVATTQAQTSGNPSAPTTNSVTLSDTTQSQTSATVVITPIVQLTSTVQAQASDPTPITERAAIAPIGTSQAQASEQATTDAVSVVTPADTSQSQTSSAPTAGAVRELADTSQGQTSGVASITEAAVVAPISTTQSADTAVASMTQKNVLALSDTAQAQDSDTATLVVSGALNLLSTTQTQVSDAVPTLIENTAVTLSDTAQSQVSGAVSLGTKAVITETTQVAFRRGTRVLPENYDYKLYTRTVTGSVTAEASQSEVVAGGGGAIQGTVVAQATNATARVRAPDLQDKVFVADPQTSVIQRRGDYRRTVVFDKTIFIAPGDADRVGSATVSARFATVVATGARVITGAAACVSARATASALSNTVVGFASANARSASTSISGLPKRVAVVNAVSRPATAIATARLVITGSVAAQAATASAAINAGLLGTVSGTIAAAAQSPLVTATGGFVRTGTVTATASSATTRVAGVKVAPATPVWKEIPTLVSRVFRSTTKEFSTYLLGGTEPISYVVSSGALPTGLTLNGQTGQVTGTTTVLGDFTLAITASNITGVAVTNTFTWKISKSIPGLKRGQNQNVVTIVGL